MIIDSIPSCGACTQELKIMEAISPLSKRPHKFGHLDEAVKQSIINVMKTLKVQHQG